MAILQPLEPNPGGDNITFEGARVVLGRHPECDIVLDAAAVSRQHAQILSEGEDYFVEDLHSRNGTYVNGQRIEGKQLLQNGDRLKICDLTYTFFSQLPSEDMPTSTLIGGTVAAIAAEIVDDDDERGSSTIMSKLDASQRRVARKASPIPRPSSGR